MHQTSIVHVAEPLSELREDVTRPYFVHPILSVILLKAVVEKVASRSKFGNDVDLACHGELLNEVHDVIAPCNKLHRIGFRDSVLLLETRVLLNLDCLDCDLGSCQLMRSNHDRVATSLTNFVRNDVLVKLVFEALLCKDSL